MDAYLEPAALERLKTLAPDKIAEELDERDKARAKRQRAVSTRIEPRQPRLEKIDVAKLKREAKERHDRMMDEADKLTEEEVAAEMEKLRKEEEL